MFVTEPPAGGTLDYIGHIYAFCSSGSSVKFAASEVLCVNNDSLKTHREPCPSECSEIEMKLHFWRWQQVSR